MANHISHASLPFPIRNARFTLGVPYLDSTGSPTDPTTPDTEFSLDAGAYADCAEEVTTITGSNGSGYITLTGAETNGALLFLTAKVASGPKATIATLYPRNLPILSSGTLAAGSSGGGTLGTVLPYDITGCFIRTTGGTGGGGTGGANNQARRIISYTISTGAFTVSTNWETTPSTDTTYDVLLPEGVTAGMVKALNPATAGRTLVVDSAGLADANTVKLGPSGSGTAQTARDIGASVLLSSGSGAGQLDFTSGVVKANLAQILGTALTETAGQIAAAFKKWFDVAAPVGTVNSIPNATAGAAGGLFIAGSNAATTANITGNLSGSIGSVTGAVGSVTGNVGGNVTGSVGSVVSFGTLVADVATAVWSAVTRTLTTVADSAGVTTLLSRLTSGRATNLDNLDATVTSRASDAALATVQADTDDIQLSLVTVLANQSTLASAISTVGTNVSTLLSRLGAWTGTGVNTVLGAFKALLSKTASAPSDIGGTFDPATDSVEALQETLAAAGDPLAQAVPGAYGAGTAGYVLGTNLDVILSTRATQASVDIIDDYVDTEVAAILAGLPSVFKKNAAVANFEFPMYDDDHVSLALGLTVVGTVSRDGGAFVPLTNSVSEVGSGIYKINLTAADLNCDFATLKFAASGADTQLISFPLQA